METSGKTQAANFREKEAMTFSIFVKSYSPDFGWLQYCLRSITKFASGFSETVVVIPETAHLELTQEKVIKIKEPCSEGYTSQQIVKMNADKYCSGDYIVFTDSDTIFTKPITPNDLMIEGKPLWLMTPMAEVTAADNNARSHERAMKEFAGHDSEWEMMRRLPVVVPRWAFPAFREYCQEKHGKTFQEWAMTQPHRQVTEFNHLGMFLYEHYRNWIHFHDTRHSIPPAFVLQKWSWISGGADTAREEFEEILK